MDYYNFQCYILSHKVGLPGLIWALVLERLQKRWGSHQAQWVFEATEKWACTKRQFLSAGSNQQRGKEGIKAAEMGY